MLPLLSLSTEVFFWLLTLGLLVLTVLFWHKLVTRNLRTVTARFTSIILIQVLALASMGITINRSGEFYSSWSDLFGAQGQYQKIALSPADLAQISVKEISSAKKTKGGSLIFRKVIKGAAS